MVVSTAICTASHGYHPPRLRHLVIDFASRRAEPCDSKSSITITNRIVCRLGLKIIPNRSKSYLAAPVCIISTAQQASPNVMGQMDPVRAQFIRLSTFEITYSAGFDRPSVEEVEGGGPAVYGAGEEEEKWRRVW
ncbi:hypothetical protein Leryth_004963 [Lithospermum erythrorhizon]|nr:hypothetical protein Leryth_004963 [Lithospermum erythrorhizon]